LNLRPDIGNSARGAMSEINKFKVVKQFNRFKVTSEQRASSDLSRYLSIDKPRITP